MRAGSLVSVSVAAAVLSACAKRWGPDGFRDRGEEADGRGLGVERDVREDEPVAGTGGRAPKGGGQRSGKPNGCGRILPMDEEDREGETAGPGGAGGRGAVGGGPAGDAVRKEDVLETRLGS